MISKKVRELFVSLMEATETSSAISYDVETDQYSGPFNNTVVDKYIELGALELVDSEEAVVILLNNRDDFLSSFAAGVREAKQGNDQSYADYNSNAFAFSVGYEHFHQMNKKKRHLADYICHGFINDATGLVHEQ